MQRVSSILGWMILLLLLTVRSWETSAHAAPPAGQTAPEPRSPEIRQEVWTGDFDQLLERRTLRVLVPFSRTLYFNDRGHERGISAENVRDFERFLNKKYRRDLRGRPLTVTIIPTTRDRLIGDLAKGLGDIAAGNLTVTPDRLKLVDFAAPEDAPRVSELLVTGPKDPPVSTVEDLPGRTVHIRKASSYYESLVALNERLSREKKRPVKIVLVPDALEDEDTMEMVNAGILGATVVDDWKVKIWSQVLPALVVHEDIVLREGGKLGWAIRKNSPLLEAEVLEFHRSHLQKQALVQVRFSKYMKEVKKLPDPTNSQGWKRFQATMALFEKYGAKYGFDPLMLAAQGYQESGLDQSRRSPVGAIGVMQIMPATGAELRVGDITVAENNIHGGAKYMDQLMTRYFPDANFDANNRVLFAFASYNAGPGRISSMRKQAVKRDLDPDQWFNNVEIVVAEKVGWETTTYVRNILKYYTAYKLALEVQAEREKAKEQLQPGSEQR